MVNVLLVCDPVIMVLISNANGNVAWLRNESTFGPFNVRVEDKNVCKDLVQVNEYG